MLLLFLVSEFLKPERPRSRCAPVKKSASKMPSHRSTVWQKRSHVFHRAREGFDWRSDLHQQTIEGRFEFVNGDSDYCDPFSFSYSNLHILSAYSLEFQVYPCPRFRDCRRAR